MAPTLTHGWLQMSLQDIDVALHRLPQDVVDARMQRLKRAVDCSLKKSYLSKELQDMQTPYAWYLKVKLSPYSPGGTTCRLRSDSHLACHFNLSWTQICMFLLTAVRILVGNVSMPLHTEQLPALGSLPMFILSIKGLRAIKNQHCTLACPRMTKASLMCTSIHPFTLAGYLGGGAS